MSSDKENPTEGTNGIHNEPAYKITPEGSLGLLALGAKGIKAWRKKRGEEKLKTKQEKTNE